MKWILGCLICLLSLPVYGQEEVKETQGLEVDGVPSRLERLEKMRERRANERQDVRKSNRNTGQELLGTDEATLSRDEVERNRKARSASRTDARRDKTLRRVRNLKKRVEDVKRGQERSLHSHQWRMARINAALEMCEDTENEKWVQQIKELEKRSLSLWEREEKLQAVREDRAVKTFQKERDSFRKMRSSQERQR